MKNTQFELWYWFIWTWPVRTMMYWFYRIRYFIKYHKDDYGKPGFQRLMYRGIPIVLRDDIPKNVFLFRQKDGSWKKLNIKTQRISKIKKVK